MDQKTFKDYVSRLEEVNTVLGKLDPTIRAEAFSVLKPYVLGEQPATDQLPPHNFVDNSPDGAEEFFTKFDTNKPADNVFLAAAYLYSRHGSQAFSINELKELANTTGLTLPERTDMTIRSAQRKGKRLFQRVGTDQYKPTVHGEAFLKTTYSIKKGTAPRLETSE